MPQFSNNGSPIIIQGHLTFNSFSASNTNKKLNLFTTSQTKSGKTLLKIKFLVTLEMEKKRFELIKM